MDHPTPPIVTVVQDLSTSDPEKRWQIKRSYADRPGFAIVARCTSFADASHIAALLRSWYARS